MKKLLTALLTALLCAALFSSAALAAEAGISGVKEIPDMAEAVQEAAVKISAKNFPDAVLRKYVADHFDKNGNGSLSAAEIEDVTTIELTNSGVKNLQGIALFPNLKVLKANYLGISKADVSGNPALEELELAYTGVSKLDLKNNKKLRRLWISGSNFTSVDLRDCPSLQWFSCAYSSVKSINLSNSAKLKTLYCHESNLSGLNVSKCAALQVLACSSNPISSLNLSGCPALRVLNIDRTGISSLNLKKNTKLEELTAGNSALTTLDVSKNTKLVFLSLRNCRLTSLTLGSQPALKDVYVAQNRLTSLDASQCPKMRTLTVTDNALTSLKLPKGKALKNLSCDDNALTSLDLSGCSGLEFLYCRNNKLTKLNVKNCPALERMDLSENRVSKLDLTANKKLISLYASGNCLAGLDLTKNTKLTNFNVNGNERSVTAEGGKIFLSDLGISAKKIKDLSGATKGSSTLAVSKSGKITYEYEMGGGRTAHFTLKVDYKKGTISSLTIPADKYAYTGVAIKPKVTVKAKVSGHTVKLTKGTHYKVYYENNRNAGTATITVRGTGDYKGTLTKTFKITKVKLSTLVLDATTMAYTGKALKPGETVKAKVNGKTVKLDKGEDYTVKYEKNIKKGTAKVIVTGIGNFTGTLTKTFTIK